MQTSEQIDLVSDALAKAQGEISPALKDKDNPAFKGTKYADLASIWDACRAPLAKNGLAVVQDVQMSETGVAVVTRIAHKSGQWIECGPIVVPMMKKDAHGVGSATTYGKRYGLSAAIGVVADLDDDGNAASGKPQQTKAPVQDAPTFITPEQEKEIADLITATKANTTKFLEYLGVRAIYEIPTSQYQQALNALQAKKKAAA